MAEIDVHAILMTNWVASLQDIGITGHGVQMLLTCICVVNLVLVLVSVLQSKFNWFTKDGEKALGRLLAIFGCLMVVFAVLGIYLK
ncbi:hypothetical protein [Bacillus thuringiensis]|uniref:hypothetical protein n=1 Tax=Bacillus thuringiensis TaxID=1428 RepID=UPI000BFD4AFA|nr:hypothetical protein [Bacillus thuringiensis]PGT89963.1 hypothetical protein COD17_09445 [Bacillus thuringiensis]